MRVMLAITAALLAGCGEVKPSPRKAQVDASRLLTVSERANIDRASREACFCRRRATNNTEREACGAEVRRLTSGLKSYPGPVATCVPFSYGATSRCYEQPDGQEFCTGSIHYGDFEICAPEEEEAIAAVWSVDTQTAPDPIIAALKRGEKVPAPREGGGCVG